MGLVQSRTSRSGALARAITVLSGLILAALGCGLRTPPAATQPPASTLSNATAQPADTPAPSQTPPAAPARLWACQRCGGNTVWELTAQGNGQVELPVQMGQYYDYSTSREAILYASHFADSGAGPSNIAVSDLWVLDVASGESFELVASDTVVEALWLPDGERAAFIEAAPDTYQLVVSDLNGQKTILAQDIAFTWGISPDGNWIAFSRESRYGLPGEPGLYSVEVSTGRERKLSDLDRAGTGSIDDQPSWSLDSQWVLFPVLSGISSAMDLARPDGSQTATLSFDRALADLLWYDQPVSSALWLPGAFQFLGQARVSGGDQMGGPDRLVLYELNSDRTAIIQAREVGEVNAFIGWQEPGISAWILSPDSDRPVLFSVP